MPRRPTVAAAFLDHRPLDETDASIRGLHDIFIRATDAWTMPSRSPGRSA